MKDEATKESIFDVMKENDDAEDMIRIDRAGRNFKNRMNLVVDLCEIILTGGFKYAHLLRKNLKSGDFKESAYKSICQFVPKFIENGTILSFYDLLAAPSWLTDDEISEHFRFNKAAWGGDGAKYLHNSHIIDQTLFTTMPMYFGKKSDGSAQTADFNTCGVIGTYNAIKSIKGDKAPSFPALLRTFEEHGIALSGNFGVSPNALNDYLIQSGFATKMLTGKKLKGEHYEKLQNDFKAFLVTVFNNSEDLSEMMHTMAITKSEDENGVIYTLNNDYTPYIDEASPKGASNAGSIEEVLNNYRNKGGHHCRPICIIGIK